MHPPTPTTALPEHLLDRWLADAELLAPRAGRDLWLREGSLLLRGWGEPHRRYHTVEHLAEVLDALDHLAGAGHLDAREGLLARVVGWYHDLHYDPRAAAGSNEHRSATMARDHLHQLGVDDWAVDAVETGVLMTVTHEAGAVQRHARVVDAVHDADLWILSAPVGRYARYREQVRAEYAHVPEPAFRTARAAVLRGFADRARLYRTEHADARWTGAARRNLAAELRELAEEG